MKLSSFSVILTFVILMIVGAALLPLVDVGTEPQNQRDNRLVIRCEWPQVSAKIIEQNLTTPIEESLPVVIIGIMVGHDNDRIDDNAKRHRNACQRINMQFDTTSTIDDYSYQDVSRQSRCHHHKIPGIAVNDPNKEQQDE